MPNPVFRPFPEDQIDAPSDAHGPPNPLSLAFQMAREAVAAKTMDRLRPDGQRSHAREFDRLQDLARKMHQVGDVALPIPNLIALELIRELDTSDQVHFLLEALFILFNQNDEAKLFLAGTERQRAIAVSTKHIKAHQVANYLLALQDLLRMLEKKSADFTATMTNQTQNLIRQASSSSSPSTMASPSPTSSANSMSSS